ncbi:MAG TPA: tetratricopeptide repeat protein [Flavisolibacter sp.]|nr:tetratricopeptide repeat protein [Flavisolibacter sp.]
MMRLLLLFSFSFFLLTSCNDDSSKNAITPPAPTSETTMDSISVEMKTARDLLEKGETDEAMRMADAMIKKYPGQLDALSIKADALKAKGKGAEAVAVLEKAYALQPRDKETAYNLAYEYADTKSSKALSLTDTLIKYDKTATVARAWYIKAYYFNQLKNEKEALRLYDSSIVADQNFLDAYFDKGRLLYQQKNYTSAERAFARGQKFDPSNSLFYLWVGKTQEAMGNKQDAKANYQRAYALDSSLTEAKDAAEKLE